MQALQTRGVNVRPRKPARGSAEPAGLPGCSATNLAKVTADFRPTDPFERERRTLAGENFRYSTREYVRRQAVKDALDNEYRLRIACGKRRDVVRLLKGRGVDRKSPEFRAAAKAARSARATYVRKYGRDPFTLADLDLTVRATAAESSAVNKIKAVD